MAKILTRTGPLIIIQLMAFWPVWHWYVRRMLDTSDEPYGIVALLTAIGFLLFNKRRCLSFEKRYLLLPVMLTVLYAATYHLCPMIVRAAIAMTALTCLLSICTVNRMIQPGLWSLSILSLPLIASLQFYAGYPLRIVVGEIAAAFLRLSGFPVVSDGVLLCWADHTISIDAPCSGIKMLWAGCYMTATLSCFFNLHPVRMLQYFSITFLMVIFGNALRATALFYSETGLIDLPSGAHGMTGLCIFLLMMIGIAVLGTKYNHSGPRCRAL